MGALALLTVRRAGVMAVEMLKKSLSSCQPSSRLTAFKARWGLGCP